MRTGTGTVGVVGLGLIGGSMARAYKRAGWRVFGYDINRTVTDFARMTGVLDDELTPDLFGECELILVGLYPEATVEYIRENAGRFHKDLTVIDLCGTKKYVCDNIFPVAEKHGFLFVGGHPMAGTHFSGFKYSNADLFRGAPMVLVPPVFDDIVLLENIKELMEPAGFGKFSVTTADRHDHMIAFTSQLAHIVSSAYIKSPTSQEHRGFSAGSYKDMTRVAWLNPGMWTELFIENRDNLVDELDTLIKNLQDYRDAINDEDREVLYRLLEDGKNIKEKVDGNGSGKNKG